LNGNKTADALRNLQIQSLNRTLPHNEFDGKMAVIEVPREELISRAKTYNADALWFSENVDELRSVYSDRYVAIHNRTVVDSDKDLRKLLSRLKQKHSTEEVGSFHIQYVTKTKIDLII